ncbi:MAG: terminase family protein, partial [Nitrospira sp.]|nr:terminase family protein [Nitrospira sp.]
TGRTTPPTEQVQECALVIGRRGGKSFVTALIAVYLACFRDYASCLGPGERGVIMIIATDRKQARVIMRYVTAMVRSVPMLERMILRQDAESVDLDNRITIEITTASYRTIRGYTIIAALCDEIAFWRSDDSANPAEEILAALRPAMATIPGALLIMLSSPYKRSGPFYENYRRFFGQDGAPVLVIQADTRTMNPSVPQRVIDQAMERDPAAASAEYLAQFRSDVGTFLDAELVVRAVEPSRRERAPQERFKYFAFTDPSGGSHDRMTLGIGHMEGHRLVLDLIRGVTPPFDPSVVVKEFANVLRSYRCSSVTGDRYAGQWVVEAFARHGITYWHSDLSKSEVYLEALPLFTTQAVDLLDYQPLLVELQQLERRTTKSGRDSVDHPPHGHDDYANAACGALVLSAQQAKHTLHMVKLTGM